MQMDANAVRIFIKGVCVNASAALGMFVLLGRNLQLST
jgi:hypothetical protein